MLSYGTGCIPREGDEDPDMRHDSDSLPQKKMRVKIRSMELPGSLLGCVDNIACVFFIMKTAQIRQKHQAHCPGKKLVDGSLRPFAASNRTLLWGN